mmetsp:Transcript_58983/g.131470  ORF Transcript_58983/g.131470 Transcript_58983/m.131470 type:complete len:213 (-) Transcript_58983:821-1459(-)
MSLHRSAPSLAMPLSTHGACIAAVPSQPRAPHASSAIPEHHINHAVPPNRVCPILLTRISRTHRTDHQHGARLPRCEECQLASQHSLIAPLEDVNVTDVKRGSLRNGDLAIVKEHPASVLLDMGDIVTTSSVGAHVADEPEEVVLTAPIVWRRIGCRGCGAARRRSAPSKGLCNSRVQVVHVAEEPIGGALQIAVGGGKCTARMLLRETHAD